MESGAEELSRALGVIAHHVGVPSVGIDDIKACVQSDGHQQERGTADRDHSPPQSKSTGVAPHPRSSLTEKEVLEIFALRPRVQSGRAARGSMVQCKIIAPRYGVTAKTVREIWRGITWTQTTLPHWTEQELGMRRARRRYAKSEAPSKLLKSLLAQATPMDAGQRLQGDGHHPKPPAIQSRPAIQQPQLGIQSAVSSGMQASTVWCSPASTMSTGGLGTNSVAALLGGGLGTNHVAESLTAAMQLHQIYQKAASDTLNCALALLDATKCSEAVPHQRNVNLAE